MTYDESDYVADNYGQCDRGRDCGCRKVGPWVGRGCPDWRPVKAQSFEAMLDGVREDYLKRKG